MAATNAEEAAKTYIQGYLLVKDKADEKKVNSSINLLNVSLRRSQTQCMSEPKKDKRI